MISKANFYVIKFKKCFFAFLFFIFIICLLLFSKDNLIAVKSGLSLWATSVVPSLFPFFVSTELLMHTNIIKILGLFFKPFMKPLFNIRGEGSFALIMGIISGYPMGAKIASTFREKNICSKEECERLLSFTNNSGPLFIIGTVGILMFRNTTIGFLLFITHLLACITVGVIFRFWKIKSANNNFFTNSNNISSLKPVNLFNLGEIISESITNSISTILIIGGFVVLFSSIIAILNSSGIINFIITLVSPIFSVFNIDINFAQGLLTGLLEITNGIKCISFVNCRKLSINLVLTAFLLGCGGFSIFLQVLSITSKTDLSIKPYIYGKLLHGFISSIYTYIFIHIFPLFNFDL